MEVRKGKSSKHFIEGDEAVIQSVLNLPPVEKDPTKLLDKALANYADWRVEPPVKPNELVISKPDELMIIRVYRTQKAERITHAATEVYNLQIRNMAKHMKK